MQSLRERLGERKLFQWAIAYLAGAWLVFQGIEVLAEPWQLSPTTQRTIHVLLGIGFVLTLVLAWYHGERGRQRVSGIELLIVAAILVVAGAAVVTVGRAPEGDATAGRSDAAFRAVNPKSVAVLPFVNVSLEGQVQRIGDQIRINAQLIDATTDEPLWAEQYDRTFADVFAIQSDVARQIALALRATMTVEEGERIAQVPTRNLEAYNSYTLGRHWWNRRTAEGLERAIDYFEDAVQKDSTFVSAYSGLADSYAVLPWYGEWSPEATYPQAIAAAHRAVELDGRSGEARTSLAVVKLWYEWDWVAAEMEFRRAIGANPSYATAHQWYAALMTYTQRLDEAIASYRTALSFDPLSAIIGANVADALYYARRYDEAIEQYVKTLELHPDFSYAWRGLGLAYLQTQMYEEAEAALREVSDLQPALAHVYVARGRRDMALAVFEAAEAGSLESQLYAVVGLGEMDRAFDILDRAYEGRALWLLEYPRLDPYFDRLRSDPRFTPLMRRIGLE
jgi:tetratricopeptide (TPR) repeat protein